MFLIAAPFSLYFIMFGKETVLFLSGNEYFGAILSMKILMPTVIFIGLTNILGIQILVPLGKEKVVLYSTLTGAIVDLIINAILIPQYASVGAAIGTLIAEFVVLIWQYLSLKKEVKELFLHIQYWKILAGLSVAFAISILCKLMNANYFVILLTSGVLFYGVYQQFYKNGDL